MSEGGGDSSYSGGKGTGATGEFSPPGGTSPGPYSAPVSAPPASPSVGPYSSSDGGGFVNPVPDFDYITNPAPPSGGQDMTAPSGNSGYSSNDPGSLLSQMNSPDFSGGNSMVGQSPSFGTDIPLPPPRPDSAPSADIGFPGANAAPNLAAVRDAVDAGQVTSVSPGVTSPGGGTGPSAAAIPAFAAGGSGGGSDLSAAARRDKPEESSFLTSLGIKNPVGSAIAAGAMGYNMLQSKRLTDALGNPSGDLAALARHNAAVTSNITPEGEALATQGAANLNTRAANLTPTAQQLQEKGVALTQYLGTGTLPPELQAQVNQAAESAKATRVSFYASRGMPTDPGRNTALRADLEAIDRNATIMGSQLASELAKTGGSLVGTGFQGSQIAGGMEGNAGNIGTNLVSAGNQAVGLSSKMYSDLAQINQAQTERTSRAIAAMAAALSGTPQSVNLKLV